ncbi:AfsR/SARP family transcriptional regulator [Nocardia sp. NPDC046473]|uniref:AfsR/SARP family transcriptional regulator n=1 Tax=Nocardia sp. NPDC046473 TaxID=3155733 RepID=UPI003411F325
MPVETDWSVTFSMLGALEMCHEGRRIVVTSPSVRKVLALFLFRANSAVAVETLVDELWDDKPPRSAVTTAQTYIYQLRRQFNHEFGIKRHDMISTEDHGYVMHLVGCQTDAQRFTHLTEQGRKHLDDHEPEQGVEVLRRALNLWTGTALANVHVGSVLKAHVAHMEEQRILALELRIDAELQLGRHRELVAELRNLVVTHPLNEWFHSRLILALSRSGRRGEALAAYQDVHRILATELGIDPSRELRDLHYEVLTSETRASALWTGALGVVAQPARIRR